MTAGFVFVLLINEAKNNNWGINLFDIQKIKILYINQLG